MASSDSETALKALKDCVAAISVEQDDADKVLLAILRDACKIVDDAEAAHAPKEILDALTTQVSKFLDDAINFAYSVADLFDFIPSFAHSDDRPEITDKMEGELKGLSFGAGALAEFTKFFNLMLSETGVPLPTDLPFPKLPPAWSATTRPHPSTTPLARFRPDGPRIPPNDVPIQAVVIYQARCEVSCTTTCTPASLSISSGHSCLALASAGGYKNRVPQLSYYILNDDTDFPSEHVVKVGLSEIAYGSVIDESRKLIFVADSSRVKSYVWSPKGNTLPTHTLNSPKWEGPLSLFPNGRLLRAGKGLAAYWDIDTLKTHGSEGTKHIGKWINLEDTWRDDPDDIEDSSGSKASGNIKFCDSHLAPGIWQHHPSLPSVMLCALRNRDNSDRTFCAINLEHDGSTISRYLGHGGIVGDLSTSEADPNAFVTACTDGYARMYDTRSPLPMLSFDSGKLCEACPAALFVHPGGVPMIFTGGEGSQQIKLWDIRARAAVYELATGNNAVFSLVWDSTCSTLYAATSCDYLDWVGHYDYRRAKIPKPVDTERKWNGGEDKDKEEKQDGGGDNDMDEEDEDEESEDDDYDDGQNWPSKAFHYENYFGHVFAAAEHRIFRFAFKADADPKVLPAWGYSTRGDPYKSY